MIWVLNIENHVAEMCTVGLSTLAELNNTLLLQQSSVNVCDDGWRCLVVGRPLDQALTSPDCNKKDGGNETTAQRWRQGGKEGGGGGYVTLPSAKNISVLCDQHVERLKPQKAQRRETRTWWEEEEEEEEEELRHRSEVWTADEEHHFTLPDFKSPLPLLPIMPCWQDL